jgi:hypothetical protein
MYLKSIFNILLLFHIFFGSISLISAALAILSVKGQPLHRRAGKIYFWAMVGIFITAIPMAIFKLNIFLLLVAIFSFYLAFAGMRFAVNRKGIPKLIDWVAVGLMFGSGIAMLFLAINYFMKNDTQFVTLIVFALISFLLAYNDLSAFKNRTATGKKRISRHLTNMLAGMIAILTAVLVTNMRTEPEWLLWIIPTATITPAIIWWNFKILSKL